MSRVRIVGGGLTGVLAALEAHRLGCRDIHLHERLDELGGVALPGEAEGLELREGCIYFGPAGDPIRQTLEAHGLAFDAFDNRFGSVSPDAGGRLFTADFGGPALPCADWTLRPLAGDSLADRLAAYPEEIAASLERYCRWHLGAPLQAIHGSAAIPLAINRVVPLGADVSELAAAKRLDPLADELYGIPRALWGRTANARASLPRGGFRAMFAQVRQVLEDLGVVVHDGLAVSPRRAFADRAAGEVLVWAANPTPLFKATGLPTPPALPKTFASYVFRARWSGPAPFYVQNFTAQGAVFRAYVYECRGETLVVAECVAEASEAALRRELPALLEGFGRLETGELLGASVRPRWIYHPTEALRRLADLRAVMAERMGAAFVAGAWEPYGKADKFLQVNAALAAALQAGEAAAAA